jgi:hypothetical protein
MDSYGSRFVYYATHFLGFLIILTIFIGISYFYQPPAPPPAYGNIQYNISSYNMSIDPQGLITFAKAQNFTPLSNLDTDNFIPIIKESEGGENITTAIKEILSMNASQIAPIPYWEAEDLAQFLNASFVGYKVLNSYTIPLSPNENETWTMNYLTFNITKFNVTIYNESYTPSTNVSYTLKIINKSIPVIRHKTYTLFPGGSYNLIGFNNFQPTYSWPYTSGGELVLVPSGQRQSTGMLYTVTYLNPQEFNVSLLGGGSPGSADGFYIGIANGFVTSWTFYPPFAQHQIYGGDWSPLGAVPFPGNTWAIVVTYDPLGPNINFIVVNNGYRYEITYWVNQPYNSGDQLQFNVTITGETIKATVFDVNTGAKTTMTLPLSAFDWQPQLVPGLYTVYVGGANGYFTSTWYVYNVQMSYGVIDFVQKSTVVLSGDGYTYNGSDPLTWLQNNTVYHLLRQGDGPYTFNLVYVMWGNSTKPYNEFIKIFTNDTLTMKMRYGDIIVNRNYTGLVGWINATPAVVPNQFGGYNYTLQFSWNIETFPVPDYVLNHPPPSTVFRNNYAFEYLEWNEYRLLANEIYNFTIQFTDNVSQHLNNNYTVYWRDEAYAIADEMLAHNLHNISSEYQHQYPIQALWDGNGTQYEVNENLALILENLMPVNITIGQHYNITSFYPVDGYWVSNWSYDYVNVQTLPQYWANDTVFLQYNYTYLTDLGSTYRYFSLWQIPNGTYNNVTLYNPLPTNIVFHYGTYYLNITPIEFYNVSTTLSLAYNATAEYKLHA